MAFASAPSYRTNRKKPKRRVGDYTGYPSTRVGTSFSSTTPAPKTPRRTTATTAPPPTAAPAAPVTKPPVEQANQAAMASLPPPATLQSQSDRLTLGQNWDASRGTINKNLLAALRAYGDPKLQGIQYDANGQPVASAALVSDPNSALSTIGRNQDTQHKYLENQYNAQGGFFSGAHLGAQGENTADADRQRAKAWQDYQDALSQLGDQLTGARTDWQSGLRGADIADLMAAGNTEPQPRAAASGPVWTPAPDMPGFFFAPPNFAALGNADVSSEQARKMGFPLGKGWHVIVRNGRARLAKY